MSEHGTTTIEIERKYDVVGEASEPAFVGVGAIAVIEVPEVRELDAVYYDTASLALAHAHVVLAALVAQQGHVQRRREDDAGKRHVAQARAAGRRTQRGLAVVAEQRLRPHGGKLRKRQRRRHALIVRGRQGRRRARRAP